MQPFRYLVTRWSSSGIQHTGLFYDTYVEANAVAEYKSEIETDPDAVIRILDEMEFLALVANADPTSVNLPDNAVPDVYLISGSLLSAGTGKL